MAKKKDRWHWPERDAYWLKVAIEKKFVEMEMVLKRVAKRKVYSKGYYKKQKQYLNDSIKRKSIKH